MLNFDMVGRLRDDRLIVQGADSGGGLVEVLEAAARGGVTLDVRGSPYGPSDPTRFYEAGAPAPLFTTGGHHDSHRPTDTAARISAPRRARLAAIAPRTLTRPARSARAPRAAA